MTCMYSFLFFNDFYFSEVILNTTNETSCFLGKLNNFVPPFIYLASNTLTTRSSNRPKSAKCYIHFSLVTQ